MKKFRLLTIVALFICVLVSLAQGQEGRTLIVTSQDVQIRFFEDPTAQWRSPEVTSVSYSFEPVSGHRRTVKLGPQIWEFLLDKDKPELGKAIVTIEVNELPHPNFRGIEFHARARDIQNPAAPLISEYSESNDVRVMGRPGRPSQTK
jgi:hypothetical protein